MNPSHDKPDLSSFRIDRARATGLTKVEFIDRDARVLPEMSAKVTFLADTAGVERIGRGAIPRTTIRQGDREKFAYVVDDEGILAARNIETGGQVGSNIEVTRCLRAGEGLVRNADEALRAGQRIKIE